MLANKRHSWWLVLISGLATSAASATQTVTQPFLGVKLYHQTETSPRPLNINVVEIDLSAPGISFQVTPVGPDPRPIGSNPGFAGQPMETIRQSPRQYANAIGAQIAINASFYSSQEFDGVFWANNLGITASNGTKYSPWENGAYNDNNFDDALNISQTNQAFLVKMHPSIPTGYETVPTVSLYNTVAGSNRLLQSGMNVTPASCDHCAVNPHTAIGLTANNAKLLLVTVDGRQPGFSEGLSLSELADWMKDQYGAVNAIGLDGGGSTQLAMNYYGDGNSAVIVNTPCQLTSCTPATSGGERLVGTSLGVSALPNGDYNQNGVVDGADYVVWRDSIGGQYAYDAWRQRYGSAAGGGSGVAEGSSVPEPSSLVFAIIASSGLLTLRRSSTRDRRTA